MSTVEELSELFTLLENTEETHDFLQDLFTPDELERFVSRWRVMRLLVKGLRPVEVYARTGISRTTIGRAHRVVKYGTGVIGKLVERLELRS